MDEGEEVIVDEPMAFVGILRYLRQKASQSMLIFERVCNLQRDRRSMKRFCYHIHGSFEWALACLTSFRSKEMCQIGCIRGLYREPEGARTRGFG